MEEAPAKGSLVSRLLLIFGVLLLLVAVGIAGFIAWQYFDAQNRYSEIQSVAGLEINTPELVDSDMKLEDLNFDWDALKAVNSDVVGWIIVPGTNINYPILQGTDNEHYLNYLFDKSYGVTGSIFADYEGSPTLDGPHNIIYGHNMLDGSMFGNINLYTGQGYLEGHRTIFICTPTQNIELVAIAVDSVRADSAIRRFTFDEPGSFLGFVMETLAEPKVQSPDMESLAAGTESLYSLVTCETFDNSNRVVVFAVPIKSVVPSNVS